MLLFKALYLFIVHTKVKKTSLFLYASKFLVTGFYLMFQIDINQWVFDMYPISRHLTLCFIVNDRWAHWHRRVLYVLKQHNFCEREWSARTPYWIGGFFPGHKFLVSTSCDASVFVFNSHIYPNIVISYTSTF